MALPMDIFVWLICLSTVIAVAFGFWGINKIPPKEWFGWHPVLMTFAFPCLMTLGRWNYLADPRVGGDTPSRRNNHQAMMITAVLFAFAGYFCIFKAHQPKHEFFGYKFETHEWKEWKRVAHVYTGYTLLLAVLAQSIMGAQKISALKLGVRVYTFHGNLGKVIIFMGVANVLLAIWFWTTDVGWPQSFTVLMVCLCVACGIFGALVPRPAQNPPGTPDEIETRAMTTTYGEGAAESD